MKYLKLFEDKETLQTLQDICLDLIDEGFRVTYGYSKITSNRIMDENSVEMLNAIRGNLNHISIYRRSTEKYSYFPIRDVRDVVRRIKNYLGDKFYYIVCNTEIFHGDYKWMDYNTLLNSDSVSRIIIIYK